MTAGALVAPGAWGQEASLPASSADNELSAALQASDRVPVIVVFDLPEYASDGLDSPAFDAAADARIARQRAIIERALGVSSAILAAPAAQGSTLRREYRSVAMVSMYLSEDEIAALLADPSVSDVQLDRPVPPLSNGTIPLIGANTMHSAGLTGAGSTIAILDTGVDHEHPMFTGRILESACFSSTVSGEATSLCPAGATSDTTTADAGDDCAYTGDTGTVIAGCGHGTHVAGIAAGASFVDPGTGDTLIGVAPGANIVAVQVFSNFTAYCAGFGLSVPCALSYSSDQIAALDWLYTNRVTLGLTSINMSLGGGNNTTFCNADSRYTVINNLRTAGVATAIASGNSGYNNAVGAPGCIEPAITVGATDDSDVVASFSNSATMVDMLAPGVSVNSAEPTINDTLPGRARSISGTSMATPHVAGAWALLRAANPSATVDQIESALESTGVNVTESPSGLVRPRIRVDLAHAALDATAPRVASITRQSPSSSRTNADSVTWRVAFNEIVTNVGSADFSVTGPTGATVATSGFTGTQVDVTVSGGDMAGLNATATLSFAGGQDIADTAGNALANTTPTGTNNATFVIDNTAPRVTSITRQTPSTSPTNADSVTWLVNFNETVSGLDVSDFVLSGTTAGMTIPGTPASIDVAAAPGDLTQAVVTASGGNLAALNGTITLSFVAGQDIVDLAGNALANTTPTGTNDNTYVVDNRAPRITSIERLFPNTLLTRADAVEWRVTFDEAVQNVGADDFTVSGTTGTLSVSILNDANDVRLVTLSGGDMANLNGTVTLGIAGGQNIADLVGNVLTNTAPTGANENTYVLDNTPPLVTSIDFQNPATSPTNADSVTWRVTFNEAVQNITTADFQVTQTTGSVSVGNVTSTTVDVTVSGGDMANSNSNPTLSFAAGQDITDTQGNALTNTSPQVTNNNFYNMDNSPPGVDVFFPLTAPTAANPTATWSLSFFENVNNLTVDDLQVEAPPHFTVSNLRITNYTAPSSSALVLVDVVSNDGNNGTLSLNLRANTDLVDELGNGNGTNGWAPSYSGNNNNNQFTVDVTAPRLNLIARVSPVGERTNADSLVFMVNFSEPVSNVDTADFVVNGNTTATVTSVTPSAAPAGIDAAANGGSTDFEVTVSGGNLADFNGVVGLDLAAAPTITDSAGNSVPTGEPETDETYDVRNIAPALASIVRLTPTDSLTNSDSLTWRLTFSQIDGSFTLPANAFTVTGTDASVTSVRRFSIGLDVTVSGGSPGLGLSNLNGDVTLGLANSDFTDDYGNVMDRTIPAGAELTYTVDNWRPSVEILGPSGPVNSAFTASIVFSEAVSGFVLTDLTVGNGTASNLSTSDNVTFTATITPTADGPVTVNLAADVATDAAGNNNWAAPQFSVSNDQTAPTTTSVDNVQPGSSPTNADTIIWAMFFSESLANLDPTDIQLSGTSATVTQITNPQPTLYAFTVSGGDLAGLNGTVTIGLAPGHNVTDAAGNALSSLDPTGSEDDRSVVFDNTAPTLTITGPAGPVSGAFTASFTFSESITGFTLGDLSVGNGTASNLQIPAGLGTRGVDAPQLDGTVFTATITPAGDGAVTVDVAPNAAQDLAGNNTLAAGQFSVTNDETAPRVASVSRQSPTDAVTDSDTLTWRVVFSEAVANVGNADFSLSGTTGSVSSVASVNGTTFDVTASGGDMANLNGNVTLGFAGGQDIADTAGNALVNTDPTGVDQRVWALLNDTVPPRIVRVVRRAPVLSPTAADVVNWELTFNEDVTNVDVGDFTLAGTTGAVTGVTRMDARNYTITASGGDMATLNGTVTIGFAGGQDVADTAGNGLVDLTPTGTNEPDFIIDNASPTPVITAPAGFDTLAPFVVTITFDEPVLFFTDQGEVTATNATVTAPSGSGNSYTATVTPNGAGDVEIGVIAQAALDQTLVNYNVAATPVTVMRDAVAPAVTLASTARDPAAGDIIVSASFTEAVSGMELADFVITNGTASNFQQLTPSIYFIRIAPAADGRVTVGLPAGVASDGVGNASLAATDFSVTADNTRPVPVISGAPNSVNSTAPFDVTVTFSEPVFFFTDAGEVSAFNASVSAPVGSGTTYTATITPQTEGDILIGVIEGAALDHTFVNSNVAASYVQVSFDATAPRLVSVERLDPLMENTNADALTWRVRFDEDVTSVDAADFALIGSTGAISSVNGSGASFEVTASGGDLGFMDGVVSLGLNAAASIADTAGNALTNTAATGSVESYTLKNAAPVLVISTTTAPPVLEAFPLTFTFSEAVTGFAANDIAATNATIGDFRAISATTYTAIATPLADGIVTISVAAFSAEDALNNGNAEASLSIESRVINPPAGTISALVSPGARSGYVGGPPLTVSAFVSNSGATPVADCSVLIPASAPVTMSWQRVDGSLNPIGAPGTAFDLPVGASASLIMTLTPGAVTPPAGYMMYPQFLCRNASADPITGVNTLLLAISQTPPPDILTSSATVSGDGVIRIPSAGGVGFLSAAAVNIGGGDDSAGLNDVTVTVTADTGSIALPVTLEVCETDPATGACLAPRSASTTATWSQNENRFFAVFVRDASGGAGVPLDPANARVYLRFTDATGTLRSITSAAVTAPAADVSIPVLASLPVGRWGVLVREAEGVWPSLTPSVLHVGPDGIAILDDGDAPRVITMTSMTSDADGLIGQFGSGDETGFWHAAGVIRQGDELASDAGDFWGVRDHRVVGLIDWAAHAGGFGSVFVTDANEIRGTFQGCSVFGDARLRNMVQLILSGCDIAGSYHATLDLPANDNDFNAPVLLIANEERGWRLQR